MIIKKGIAREGAILLFVIVAACILFVVINIYRNRIIERNRIDQIQISKSISFHDILERDHRESMAYARVEKADSILAFGIFIIVVGYFLYVLFRFIAFIRNKIKVYSMKVMWEKSKGRFRVVFAIENLVRIALILGIIYLCLSILNLYPHRSYIPMR